MKTLGNVIWFILGGLYSGVVYFLTGIICCVTIVLIPIGIKYFKLARLTFLPFGKTVDANFDDHPVKNTFWLCCGGLSIAAGTYLLGVVLCITIIGIPFAKQCFKIARYAISPYGAEINSPA